MAKNTISVVEWLGNINDPANKEKKLAIPFNPVVMDHFRVNLEMLFAMIFEMSKEDREPLIRMLFGQAILLHHNSRNKVWEWLVTKFLGTPWLKSRVTLHIVAYGTLSDQRFSFRFAVRGKLLPECEPMHYPKDEKTTLIFDGFVHEPAVLKKTLIHAS